MRIFEKIDQANSYGRSQPTSLSISQLLNPDPGEPNQRIHSDPKQWSKVREKLSKRWLNMTYMDSGVVRLETGRTQAPTVLKKRGKT